jgi:hypothetical protein
MVGDLQQSIFGQRADLGRYRAFHEQLTSHDAAKALEFTTTFRCDQRIVDFVNATFPNVFSSQGQVDFVALRSRSDAGTGQVLRWAPELPDDFDPEIQDYQKGRSGVQLAAGSNKTDSKITGAFLVERRDYLSMKRWFGTIVRASFARARRPGAIERDQKAVAPLMRG